MKHVPTIIRCKLNCLFAICSIQIFVYAPLGMKRINWYTRPIEFPNNVNSEASDAASEPKYCYCFGPEDGTMIACDNPDCPFEWFHFKYLQLTTTPKGKWIALIVES